MGIQKKPQTNQPINPPPPQKKERKKKKPKCMTGIFRSGNLWVLSPEYLDLFNQDVMHRL